MSFATPQPRPSAAGVRVDASGAALPVYASDDFIQTSPSWMTSQPSTSGGIGFYWPALFHAGRYLGGDAVDEWYCYCSTDHSNSAGGIGLMHAPHLAGPWSWQGSAAIFSYGGSGGVTPQGRSTETPTLIWDHGAGRLNMLFHNGFATVNGVDCQPTGLAVSSNASCTAFAAYDNGNSLPWVIGPSGDEQLQGVPHYGYARVAHVGRLLTAVHRYDGKRLALMTSHSLDYGKTWTPNWGSRHFSGRTFGGGGVTKITPPRFLRLQGQLWALITGAFDGASSPAIALARYADDGSYCRPLHAPAPIVAPSAAGREVTTADAVVHGGRLWVIYSERLGPADDDLQHPRIAYIDLDDLLEANL